MVVNKFVEMSSLLQNMKTNLRTRVKFLDSFVVPELEPDSNSVRTNRCNLSQSIETTIRLNRRGFSRVDEDDYRYRLNNKRIHSLCGSFRLLWEDNSWDILIIQFVCQDRTPKILMFNDDKYSKKGRPSKSLLEQVLENNSVTLDTFTIMHWERKMFER